MAEYKKYEVGYEFYGYSKKKITAKSEEEARDILRQESDGDPISNYFDTIEYVDFNEVIVIDEVKKKWI